MQAGLGHPGIGHVGLCLEQGRQLLLRVFQALLLHQHAHIRHLYGRCGLVLHVILDHWLDGQAAGFEQFQRQQCRGAIAWAEVIGLFQGLQCQVLLAGHQAQMANRGPGCRPQGGVLYIGLQRLLDHAGCHGLVAGTAVQLGNRQISGGFGGCGGPGDFAGQVLLGFGDAIEHQQNLEHVAVGVARLREGLVPLVGHDQRTLARAGLQGQLGGPLVQLRRLGLAGGIHEQRNRIGGIALGGGHLSDQQFIEQLRIQGRGQV